MIYLTIELLIDTLLILLKRNTPEVQKLARGLLEIYDNEVKASPSFKDNQSLTFYTDVIRDVLATQSNSNEENISESIILKVKSMPLVNNDPELFATLKRTIGETKEVSDEHYQLILTKITNALMLYKVSKYTKKIFSKLNAAGFNASVEQQSNYLKEISNLCNDVIQINEDREGLNKIDDPNQARIVDFQQRETIKKALSVYKKTNVTNKFVTGWQGMNRALEGGITLGASIVFNSLSFHGKSLMLLNCARWLVTYNHVSADFKNPTCLFFSLENETPQNLILLFKSIWINKYKQVPPADISEDQMIDFCFDEFNQCGWKLVIDREMGTEFGFPEFVAKFQSYEKLGYTPLVCIIDYMNLMNKGNSGARDDLLIQQLYSNVCNFCRMRNCTLITAHQLNRDAATMARMNPIGVVKRLGISHLANGMDPQREVDITFYQYKEFDSLGRPWLTLRKDKDRYHQNTPEDKKFFAYRFDGELGILDDLHEADMSSTNIYAESAKEEVDVENSVF